MGFSEVLNLWPESRVRELILQAKPDDVKRALQCDDLSPRDLAALLSPVAASSLEEMARLSTASPEGILGEQLPATCPFTFPMFAHPIVSIAAMQHDPE